MPVPDKVSDGNEAKSKMAHLKQIDTVESRFL